MISLLGTSIPIWDNPGIVRGVSPDRTRITIALPNGGTIDAPNAGFSVGQSVCFSYHPTTHEILEVVSREVAETKRLLFDQPEINSAVGLNPMNEENTEVSYDDECSIDEDLRLVDEINAHYGVGEHREGDFFGEDYNTEDTGWDLDFLSAIASDD